MKFHTFLAIVVLVAAGAWVATGKYSFVGSEIHASESSARADETTSPAASSTAGEEAATQLQTVAVVTAQNTVYERHRTISGLTEADKRATLAARTAGAVAQVAVEKGDRVAEGELIMALEGPEKYAAVSAAEVLVEQRRKLAEVDQDLLARGKIAPLKADQSQADLAAARSTLEAARAEVDRLELRAPFAAIVDDVFIEQGTWAQPGIDAASLIALDPILAVGEVSERDLASVSLGMAASVRFADGTRAEGTVRYIRREATAATRTFPIEVAVPNPELTTPAGMSAEITLTLPGVPSVTVPRSVITLGPDGEIGVRIVESDDAVAFLPVTVVDDTPKGLVVAGIADGTRVIVSGQDLVGEGQNVIAVDVPPAVAAQAIGSN